MVYVILAIVYNNSIDSYMQAKSYIAIFVGAIYGMNIFLYTCFIPLKMVIIH